jgi:hypothetical protein
MPIVLMLLGVGLSVWLTRYANRPARASIGWEPARVMVRGRSALVYPAIPIPHSAVLAAHRIISGEGTGAMPQPTRGVVPLPLFSQTELRLIREYQRKERL